MWMLIENNIDELLKQAWDNPMSADEYLDIYADYRELHPWPSFDDEFIEAWLTDWLEKNKQKNNSNEAEPILNNDESSFFIFYKNNFNNDNDGNGDGNDNFYVDVVSNLNTNNNNNLDLSFNFVNYTHGWLYSFTENFFAYTYDITYYIFQNFIYVESPHIKFRKYWINSLRHDQYGYLNAFIMDQLYALTIILLPFFNEFFKHFASTIEFNNFLENHPEYYLIFKDYLTNYYFYYFSNFYVSLYSLNITESFLTPVMVVFQFFFIISLILGFFIVYFNYYGTLSSEENLIDHDYLIFNVTIEAEEEIGSLDDMLLASVILLYVFLWFFWIHSWSSFSITPRLTMSVYVFPFIYYIIVFIPFSLLYDYGLYFLTYLNGVGKSSAMLIELMFDYIAVSIFYLRLIVQNVRLAFMLFTFIELHELVIFYTSDKNLLPLNESFIDSWDNIKVYQNPSSYFLLTNSPVSLLKWLYELFHTFFMVIFQFVAFFAMIFWLFLFLYSMFVSETQENHFTLKRFFRKDFYKERFNFKLVRV